MVSITRSRSEYTVRTRKRIGVRTLLVAVLLFAGCEENWPPEVVDPPSSPVLSPDRALESLVVPPGFRVELVAAEPLIEDPVAIDFDADGRIYAAEMRGWMRDIDGNNALEPIGKIVVLEDTDGDGRMDERTVFMDSLVLPNGVKALSDGILISEPNNLWFARDVDGDFAADEKTLISDEFGIRKANMEANANGLVWGMDNWIHTTWHDARFRRQNGEWIRDSTKSVGQFGLTMDDFGRMYRNDNTRPVFADFIEPHYCARNPNLPGSRGTEEAIAQDRQVWPIRTTPGANRGYQENTLREDGTLRTFTAACGPGAYRGGGYPNEFTDNVNLFVPEPVGNLVARFVIEEQDDGTRRAVHGDEGTAFLASTDERFRPVNSISGPDGALYVVDMYRGIVEHRDFVTTYLRRQIESRNLDEPVGLGRIYRVVHDDAPSPQEPPRLSNAPVDEVVEHLSHRNGWWRDTAQRLLVERGDTTVASALRALAALSKNVRTRLHALWTLEGLGVLEADIVRAALDDGSPFIRAAAIRLAEPWLRDGSAEMLEAVGPRIEDEAASVRLQLAVSLGEAPHDRAAPLQRRLVTRYAGQPFVTEAVVSGLYDREMDFMETLLQDESWSDSTTGYDHTVNVLASAVIRSGNPERIDRLFAAVASEDRPKWQRLAILEGIENQFPSSTGVLLPLELPQRPASLDRALQARDAEVREEAEAMTERLTWPGRPGAVDRRALLTLEARERYDRGREIYAAQCAQCHGEEGQGEEGIAVPLVGSEWVHGGHYNLVRILLQGKEGELGLMPPQNNLTDQQIADVLTYVRNAWGNSAYPVTESQAADLRAETAARREPWKDAELEATAH